MLRSFTAAALQLRGSGPAAGPQGARPWCFGSPLGAQAGLAWAVHRLHSRLRRLAAALALIPAFAAEPDFGFLWDNRNGSPRPGWPGPGVQGILHAGIRAARAFTKQYNGMTGALAR